MRHYLSMMIAGTLWLNTECLVNAQPAYFSLTGNFLAGGDQHDFYFDLTRPVSSAEVLRFETFANGGGMNGAGQSFFGGGIDSVLELFDSGGSSRGRDDDGSFAAGTDSLLSWPGVGELNAPPNHAPLNPDPPPAGGFRLMLSEFGNNDPGQWAVDLVGPADAIVFTDDIPIGTSAIRSLTAGNGAQVSFGGSYELNGETALTFQSGADATVTSYLDIGNTSDGTLVVQGPGTTLTTNTASTTFLDWGRDGGEALVYVSAGASATINAERIDMAADTNQNSVGILAVQGGATMTANTINVGTGCCGILTSEIRVEDFGSTITQNGAASLSIGGPSADTLSGILRIANAAVFNAGSGAINANRGGDIIVREGGVLNTGGFITVASVGHPAGGGGSAGVELITEGQITSFSVHVGSNTADGSVLIDGFVPGVGLRATWHVTNSMTIGSDGFGSGSATVEQAGLLDVSNNLTVAGSMDATGTLTVQTNGQVDVGNQLTVANNGTVNLLGSEITARSFIVAPGGTLTHTDGALTVDGGQFTMQLGTHTIDSSGGAGLAMVRLVNGAQGSVEVNVGVTPVGDEGVLYVGRDGRGRMEILNGSRMVSGTGWIASGTAFPGPGEGSVLVQGAGSVWEVTADAGGSSIWDNAFSVGFNGAGILEIRDGGQVVVHGSRARIGSPSTVVPTGQGGPGIAIVEGAGSLLRVENSPVLGSVGVLGIGAADPVTGASGSLTVSNRGRVEADTSIKVVAAGSLLLTSDGEIHTGSFFVEPGGTFTHTDGTLTVDGGTFDPGVASYAIDGAGPTDRPKIRLTNGASASLQCCNPAVGSQYHGRLEILNGSHVLTDPTALLHIGLLGEGEVIVDGDGSELTGQGTVIVGNGGRGTLRILNGGSATVPNQLIGAALDSQGTLEVTGIGSSMPSTYTTSGELVIGDIGRGTLLISAGGLVNALAGAGIAMYSDYGGSDNSSATVTGIGSHWAITGPLYVGGNDTSAGSIGSLNVENDGLVTAGSVKVWQPGTIELNSAVVGASTLELAGGTLQGSGTVLVSGALVNGGMVSPGLSPGVITVSGGNYVQGATGTLAIEIGGQFSPQYDRLDIVRGTATLAGTLDVSLVDLGGGLFAPSAGQTFDIVTAAAGLGGTAFTTELLPALAGGLYFDVRYDPTVITLVVSGVLGDYNRNGVVDAADYTVWRNSLGQTGVHLAADGNFNNEIDAGDYEAWRAHFGQTAGGGVGGPGSGTTSAVPEPTSALLLLSGLLAMCRCRRADAL